MGFIRVGDALIREESGRSGVLFPRKPRGLTLENPGTERLAPSPEIPFAEGLPGFGVTNDATERVGDRVGLMGPTGGAFPFLFDDSWRAVTPTYLLARDPGEILGGSGVLKGNILPRLAGVIRPDMEEDGRLWEEATDDGRTGIRVTLVASTKTPQFGAQEKYLTLRRVNAFESPQLEGNQGHTLKQYHHSSLCLRRTHRVPPLPRHLP